MAADKCGGKVSCTERRDIRSFTGKGTRTVLVLLALTVAVSLACRQDFLSGAPLKGSNFSSESQRSEQWQGVEDLERDEGKIEPLYVADLTFSGVSNAFDGTEEVTGNSRKLLASDLSRYENASAEDGLYHNFDLFEKDYAQMEKEFRIFVYPEAYEKGTEFSNVFLPHTHPRAKNIGNYFSEHQFKITLLESKFVTKDPNQAHLFFLPFSVNVMRNDERVRQEKKIVQFVGDYITNVSNRFGYWNRSGGADHFFVCCHSVGRDVPQALPGLRTSAIQLICSSNYYYKNYIPHKDVALPQVWPRRPLDVINPPELRTRLAFYAGRLQNSVVRQTLVTTWGDDPDMDVFAGGASNGTYEQHFQRSKFCVHVRGYEVNTARISDAIHFGCVPVIISEYYDLPLGDILDWDKFSIILSYTRIPLLKQILQGMTDEEYAVLHENVLNVRKHFQWNDVPKKYDVFHMSLYQLWLKRFVVRDSSAFDEPLR